MVYTDTLLVNRTARRASSTAQSVPVRNALNTLGRARAPRSTIMHATSDAKDVSSISISSLPETFQCNVLQPQTSESSTSNKKAVILLSDIFGCGTKDTLHISQVFANELQCAVYVPDVFHGTPWPEGKPVSGNERDFESWRSGIGGQWPVDVAEATTQHIREASSATDCVALIGFCFGGGRVVDVLAYATKTKLGDKFESFEKPASEILDSADLSLGGLKIRAGVSFYGTRISKEALGYVNTPLGLYFASEDPLVPREDVTSFEKILGERGMGNEAGASSQETATAVVHTAEGQPHGFVHQAGKGDADAAADVRKMGVKFILDSQFRALYSFGRQDG